MQIKQMVLIAASAAFLSGEAGLALAQQPSKPAAGMQHGDGGSMDRGMMGGADMMGGMMGGGGMGGMMGGGMMGGHHGMMSGMMMVPRMPPGNEKLEFQMRAEMMQKMGEIAMKYASQVKEEKGSRR